MKQTTFASLAWNGKGKITRRERFLAEMDAVIPWARLAALIEPHYPKAGNGTQPMPLERMLRIYFMQNWFNLSDPAAEDSLYDSESMRRFAGIELARKSRQRNLQRRPGISLKLEAMPASTPRTPRDSDVTHYGASASGDRYFALSQIKRDNLGGLSEAGRDETGPGGLQIQPLVIAGARYAVTPDQTVFALDARR